MPTQQVEIVTDEFLLSGAVGIPAIQISQAPLMSRSVEMPE